MRNTSASGRRPGPVRSGRGTSYWVRILAGGAALAVAGGIVNNATADPDPGAARTTADTAASVSPAPRAEPSDRPAAGAATGTGSRPSATSVARPTAKAGAQPTAKVAAQPTATSRAHPTAKTGARPSAGAAADTALAVLDGLEVKGRAPRTGYERERFGQAWLDVDRNGCDTRNDMLRTQLTDVVFANSVPCKVASGTLADPYTATVVRFVRGQRTSTLVQIDHVVALSDAWQKGAQRLTAGERAAFANDPLNLQATDGATNARKGAGDAATWLPPNTSHRCSYVARQIAVKAKYRLWVARAEHGAMSRVLAACPGQRVPRAAAGAVVPARGTVPSPAAPKPAVPKPAVPKPAATRTAVGYENCAAVRAAGADPIRLGDPGFEAKFDGDGDGVGCE